jgi:predicted ATPase
MRRGADNLREQNAPIFDGLVKLLLSEAEARAGDPERALADLTEALATAERLGYRAFEAELHRARGELLLSCDAESFELAEEDFQTALAVASQQGARTWGLRAALSLARLFQSTHRLAEAHAILAPALENFSPTPEMSEIAEAQALLAALAETGEVKAELAREQRLRLESNYAAAIGWSRGFAGAETRAAFDRVETALAAHPGADPLHLPALEGRWATAMMRGEMAAARSAAEVFLAAAERTTRAPTMAVARRSFGATLVVQGNLARGLRELQEAIELAEREPFADPETGVAPEAGASATAHLSLAAWVVGEFERSHALIEQASLRAESRRHIPTGTVIRYLAALREILRGDALACLPRARAFVEFCETHRVEQFRGAGQALLAWAEARAEPMMTGAKISRFRATLADLEARGHRLYLPLSLGRLAEIELVQDDAKSALGRIEAAAKLAEDSGQHLLAPFLDRLLGETLLARADADAARAEEAFQRSIERARDMGARAFLLQAALPLAKLHKSTARPAEARAVLAPALENFSPTPEMPEIAEAQALMGRLA